MFTDCQYFDYDPILWDDYGVDKSTERLMELVGDKIKQDTFRATVRLGFY